MAKATIIVRASWDPEAEVWVATSDDVLGLVAEAATPQELERKLHSLIPVLLEENDGYEDVSEVPMVVLHEQTSRIRLRA